MKEIIIIMGGQGAGKGTFSAMLRGAKEYDYIETGAMFRSLPADSEIAGLIAAGALVPDEMLFELVGSRIGFDRDILIDGFPRTLPQAQWFVRNYSDKFRIRVVYLNVPEEIMLLRIQKRLRVDGCGRADDADEAAVRRRLDIFHKVTMPAIEWLASADGVMFSDVDAAGSVDENFRRIQEALISH
jgi:adenylate kinase